jgi:Cysteine rich repeat
VFKRMRPEMVVSMSARAVRARCDGRTFDMKPLTCVAALGAALLMTHSASAAAPLGKACAADIKAQCADVKPGGGKIRDCLKAHSSDLSEGCQEAINSAAAVGKACKADVKQFCADVKPGKGAIKDCMKAHAADVSDGCKEAMAKAEAGNK